jgi:hypothetical protein
MFRLFLFMCKVKNCAAFDKVSKLPLAKGVQSDGKWPNYRLNKSTRYRVLFYFKNTVCKVPSARLFC